MAQTPEWIQRLDEISLELRSTQRDTIDRSAVERIYRVQRRQAIELMKKFGARPVKGQLVLDRPALLALMDSYAEKPASAAVPVEEFIDPAEQERRRQFAARMAAIRDEWSSKRQQGKGEFLIAAPRAIAGTQLRNLPQNVRLEPGKITVEFESPDQAKKLLLMLALALANDESGFDDAVGLPSANAASPLYETVQESVNP